MQQDPHFPSNYTLPPNSFNTNFSTYLASIWSCSSRQNWALSYYCTDKIVFKM